MSVFSGLSAGSIAEASFELEEDILWMEKQNRNLDSASLAKIVSDAPISNLGSFVVTPTWELGDRFFDLLQERAAFRSQVLVYLSEPQSEQKPKPNGKKASDLGEFGSDQIVGTPTENFSFYFSSTSSYQDSAVVRETSGRHAGLNFQVITNRKLMRYYAIRSDGPPYLKQKVRMVLFLLLSPGEYKCNLA